jgi:hypothetical protein
MRSEREKMLAGELYDALDPELVAARNRGRDLCQMLNASREGDQELRRFISCGQIIQTSGLSFMMDVSHARQQMGSAVGVRHRVGQSKTPAPE